MYRQAIAFSIRSRRPGCDVKIASPGATVGEIAVFKPHLLMHNDNDMDARITARGKIREAQDMSTEDLIRVVDVASTMAGE